MAVEFAAGADADISAGLTPPAAGSTAAGAAGGPSIPPAPTGATAAGAPAAGADAPDPEIEKLLDAYEKGTALPGSQQQGADPTKGLDLNHPIVQQLLSERQTMDNNQRMAEVARQLASSGAIDRRAIPEFMDFLNGVQQLKNEYDQMRSFLGKLDSSDLVLSANVNKMVKKYGRYGVTAEDLKVAARPDSSAKELETVAITLATLNRRKTAAQRAKDGADTVEDTRSRGSVALGDKYADLTTSADDLIRAGMKR